MGLYKENYYFRCRWNHH